MSNAHTVAEAIKKVKTVIIIHHVAPDGDCLGSALALRKMIRQLDNIDRVDTVITGNIPDVYKFLPGIEHLKKPADKSLHNAYDLAITVDCASKDRLGDAAELFNNTRITINIDHHISNSGFANIDWIDPYVSATGEVLFDLIEALGVELTDDIATNLYTAILTDTGGFKFENTKPATLRKCARLIEAGADPVKIYKECYEQKPFEMVMLHSKAINDAVFLDDNTIVYSKITRKLLQELNASDEHIDGITEELRQIKTVQLSLVFKETLKKTTKVSFRSNGINVCEIASFFGGGGHKLAAGCLIEKNIDEAINDVILTVRNQINRLKSKS